jgi:hypothetical protein
MVKMENLMKLNAKKCAKLRHMEPALRVAPKVAKQLKSALQVAANLV